jgi:hypothetical protein
MGAYGFITTKKIEDAYKKYEFFGLIIYGEQGIGKTTYMLKVMYDVYGDWNTVFEHLIFSLDDLIDLIEESRGKRFKVIGWDDAGIHGHKYKYFRKRDAVELISAWLDVARTKTASLLITTVNPLNLLKPIRESLGMKYGKVVRYDSANERLITVYNRTILPNGKTYVKKMYADKFTAILPDHVYERYLKLRSEFYRQAEEQIMKVAKKSLEETEEEEELRVDAE